MVDLLNIKETAYMLGMTSGEVKRLVKERSIPFVDLPNGVRFCPDDLTIWINKNKGGDMTTATMTEREQMQRAVRRLPELREEMKALRQERTEVQTRIDAGELTQAAARPLDTKIEGLMNQITTAEVRYRGRLLDECPDEDMKDRRLILLEDRKQAMREVASLKRKIEQEEDILRNAEKALQSLSNGIQMPDYLVRSQNLLNSAKLTEAEQRTIQNELAKFEQKKQSRIGGKEREVKNCRLRIEHLEESLQEKQERHDAIRAEIEQLKEEMIQA